HAFFLGEGGGVERIGSSGIARTQQLGQQVAMGGRHGHLERIDARLIIGASLDPGGVQDISRWSSGVRPPDPTAKDPMTLKGSQMSFAPSESLAAGVVNRWFRCAQPPANFCDASGVGARAAASAYSLRKPNAS